MGKGNKKRCVSHTDYILRGCSIKWTILNGEHMKWLVEESWWSTGFQPLILLFIHGIWGLSC